MSLAVNIDRIIIIMITQLVVINTKVNIQKKCITIFKSSSIFRTQRTYVLSKINLLHNNLEKISLYSTHPISSLAPMFYLKSICYTIILETISLYSTHPIGSHIAPMFYLIVVNKCSRGVNVYVVSS
jgi:hypothetical protein